MWGFKKGGAFLCLIDSLLLACSSGAGSFRSGLCGEVCVRDVQSEGRVCVCVCRCVCRCDCVPAARKSWCEGLCMYECLKVFFMRLCVSMYSMCVCMKKCVKLFE